MKPLPRETRLLPGDHLNMSITINASITSPDDITLSLGHSSRGIYEDLTNHLVSTISENEEPLEGAEDSRMWTINMTVPYPHSQASGDLTLSVGDKHSGDITSTRLVVGQEGNDVAPFFDPAPRSVKTYPGQYVLIDTEAKGSSPIKVTN